jgi:hypothetical protein
MTLQESELLGRGFRFERADGSIVNNLLQFSIDRRIVGSSHPNETFWQIRDGKLAFLDNGGTMTTDFFQVSRDDGGLVITGGFVPRDPREPWHILREIAADLPDVRNEPAGDGGTGARLSVDDLLTKIFLYKDTFGVVIAPAVYFLPDGRLIGTRNPR